MGFFTVITCTMDVVRSATLPAKFFTVPAEALFPCSQHDIISTFRGHIVHIQEKTLMGADKNDWRFGLVHDRLSVRMESSPSGVDDGLIPEYLHTKRICRNGTWNSWPPEKGVAGSGCK